jgi:hypothetical protein
MLIRIYRCADCSQTTTTGLEQRPIPLCPSCRGPMKWQQTRDYIDAAHWPRLGQAPALDYNQTKERIAPLGDRGIQINSLNDIRRIERESEQQVRDGVPGAQLHVFRKYSQDHSNEYVHTLRDTPQQGPSKEWMRKNGHLIGSIAESGVEAIEGMGPGAREDLASHLPVDPL